MTYRDLREADQIISEVQETVQKHKQHTIEKIQALYKNLKLEYIEPQQAQ